MVSLSVNPPAPPLKNPGYAAGFGLYMKQINII